MSGLFAPPDDARSHGDEGAAAVATTDTLGPGAAIESADASAPSAPIPGSVFNAPVVGHDEPIDYVVPTPVQTPRRPASRKKAVGWLGAGALLLGAAGGVGGAAAWDAWGPTQSGGTLPVSRPAGDITPAAGTVAAVSQAVLPSVVQIEALNGGVSTATGSGVVIRADGYILTNNHVVESSDGAVEVLFSDGSVEQGIVVGKSAEYDLAVVQVEATDLTALPLGDSDAILVGDPVIAIGSPLGLDSTVTTGIVSAMNRPVTTGESDTASHIAAIQTDAAINPGNSGGPLLNMAGEIIGINSAIAALPGATQATGAGSVGLGFAIPSNQARRVSEELIATGKARVPVMGALLDRSHQGRGVRVADSSQLAGAAGVPVGSPAAEAGIKEGEIIVAIDGDPVANPEAAIVRIRAHAPGDEVTFTLERDGKDVDVVVTLGSRDEIDYGDAVEGGDGSE